MRVGRADAEHGETAGKTRDGAEQTLEGLGEVVRDEVLVDLRGSDVLVIARKSSIHMHLLTCNIVMKLFLELDSAVSPHKPMTFLSFVKAEMKRLSE